MLDSIAVSYSELARIIADVGGLSVTQYRILLRVSEVGPMRIGDLAIGLNLQPNTTSVAADRLASAGLVTKSIHPDDKRLVVIAIRPEGEARVASVDATVAETTTIPLAPFAMEMVSMFSDPQSAFAEPLSALPYSGKTRLSSLHLAAIAALHQMATELLGETGGLSLTEYRLLLRARDTGGAGAPLSTLASALDLRPNTISTSVDRLERLGLAHKERDPADRRITYLALAEEGRSRIASIELALEDIWGTLFTPIAWLQVGQAAAEFIASKRPAARTS